MKKLTIILPVIISMFFLASCLKEDPMKKPYTGFDPLNISDGWTLSNPSLEQIDSLALDKIYKDVYADDEMWMTKSMLVFRNGKLVAESYLKDDADRTKTDAIWSCTKQVNSIITGIAIDRGFINGVSDPIGDYLPEYIAKYPDKAVITLENLLEMKSGIAFDNGTQSDIFRQHKTDNSLDYVLGLKLKSEPGTEFYYKDGDPQLISGIVQAATGKTLDEYGKEVLFDPLGITNYKWDRYSDGVTLGAFGILTCPRELAKVAQCVLDSGRHNGVQVIPEAWLREMLIAKVPEAGGNRSFGYLWWSIPSKGYWFMWGHGGQYAFIVPEKNMLVVFTSLSQVDDDVNISVDKIIGIVDSVVLTAQ
jgi:CubicO group peptidase (beta-lactamase class C family)